MSEPKLGLFSNFPLFFLIVFFNWSVKNAKYVEGVSLHVQGNPQPPCALVIREAVERNKGIHGVSLHINTAQLFVFVFHAFPLSHQNISARL